jgi:hypothetical protein
VLVAWDALRGDPSVTAAVVEAIHHLGPAIRERLAERLPLA